MHSHQSYPNIPTVVIVTRIVLNNVDNSTIEPYKNRGLGKQKNNVGGKKYTSILYDIINCHPRVSHNYRIHGKLGLQLSFTNSTIGGGQGCNIFVPVL